MFAQRQMAAPAGREAFLVLAAIAGACVCSGLLLLGHERLALSSALLAFMLGAAVFSPAAAVTCAFAYVSVLGDFRRLFIGWWGWSDTDPLILVAPAVTVFLVGAALAQRRISFDTPVSRTVMLLTCIMIAQMFNPLQGGLIVGVGGALFYLVPLLWFWIGRTYLTTAHLDAIFTRVFIPIAIVASLIGLYQVFYGYLPHQQSWFDVAGYGALRVRGTLRPIGVFPSSAEFLNYINKAAVLIWTLFLLRRSPYVLAIPIIFLTILLSGTRGPVVYALAGMTTAWAFMGGTAAQWVPRLVGAVLIGVIALFVGLESLRSVQLDGPVQMALDHQIDGLTNPGESTAVSHLMLIQGGIRSGITQYPLGRGLGSTTMAAARLGGTSRGSSEVDFSDMFIALGVFGGLTYLVVIGLVFRMVLRYWRDSRDPMALCVGVILVVGLGGWLMGSHYSVSAFIWIGIGVIDRAQQAFYSDDD